MTGNSVSRRKNSSIWNKLVGAAIFAGLFWGRWHARVRQDIRVKQDRLALLSDPENPQAREMTICHQAGAIASHALPGVSAEAGVTLLRKSTYTLLYDEDIFGLEKRIEFEAINSARALEIAECEAQGRRATLLEDGRLLCRIEKGSGAESPFWIIGGDGGTQGDQRAAL